MDKSKQAIWKQTQQRLWRWWTSLVSEEPQQHNVGSQPLGLALGSGGLRGAAHVGVLAVLEEQGLAPQVLAGTSAGSVVAALYAAGYTSQRMQELMGQLTPDLFTDLTMPRLQLLVAGASALRDYLGTSRQRITRGPGGLVKGERFEEWLRDLLYNQSFDDLSIPTYVVATDLADGKAVVFGPSQSIPQLPVGYRYVSGVPLADAVRASCSIPLIFEPAQLNGRVYIDGAFSDPVPTRILCSYELQTIIAVDLAVVGGIEMAQKPAEYNLFQTLSQATSFLTDRYSAEILQDSADLVIRPCADRATLTEVALAERFVREGKRAAWEALQQWRQQLE